MNRSFNDQNFLNSPLNLLVAPPQFLHKYETLDKMGFGLELDSLCNTVSETVLENNIPQKRSRNKIFVRC